MAFVTNNSSFRAALAVAAAVVCSPAAQASCQLSPLNFFFQDDKESVRGTVSGSCTTSYTAGGSITSLTIATRPAHGSVSDVRLNGFTYTPKPGTHGTDSMAVKVCGVGKRSTGCSLISYTFNM